MNTLIASPIVTATLLLVASNVFMTFAVLYMNEPLHWNYLWAGRCLMGAVYFIFKT